mgnify:CR=1 FL=1
MKILHTSDWHLGHTLYNYDRTAEQQSFLRQLTRIVTEEQPDAMVVSGDIYHYSSPAAATQKMYTDAMLNIHQACPGMAIVVTAGNHDSSSKLEIDSSLWQHFGLNVVGNIERTAEEVNLDKHIIEINNEKKTIGYVIAVPHVYPQNFPLLDTETPRDQRQARFFQALLDEVKKRNTAQLPVVLMAHLSIEGSDRSGHDESIGGIEYVPLSAMGEGYDYLALGHIHCPQDIKGIVDVLTVADSLDAATDNIGRCYNLAKPFHTLLEELRAQSGTRYAPDVVALFRDETFCKVLAQKLDAERKKVYLHAYHAAE